MSRALDDMGTAVRASEVASAPPIRYDAALVEEAVFRVVRALPPERQGTFYRDRNAAYEAQDAGEREKRFQAVHAEWFRRLGLHAPLSSALAERADRLGAVEACLVTAAASRGGEMADLLDVRASPAPGHRCAVDRPARAEAATPGRVLVLRVRPESLADADRLGRFLRHELTHVTDMLDPAFGYERALPAAAGGAAFENILRDRYRVVWDTTIDGRLSHAGTIGPEARETRRREFVAAFSMLGARAEREFARWFDDPAPTHQAIVAFILSPRALARDADRGRAGQCPVCEFPIASLDSHADRLSSRARTAIQSMRPAWRIEDGLCTQCADLYDTRYGG